MKDECDQLYSLSLTLTDKCNLSCSHCGASENCSGNPNSGNELTLEEYHILLEQASKLGCRHLILAGGEPFVREDIWSLLAHAEQLDMSCAILTNGVLVNQELVNKLATFQNVAYVRLSVDYPDDRMDDFRGMPNLVNAIFAAVRRLREHNIKVGIGMTIMPDNLRDIHVIAEKADEAGANFFRATPIMPIGRASGMDIDETFFSEAAAEMIKVAKLFQPFEFSTVVMPNDLSDMGQSLLLTCPGGNRTAAFSSDGRISRCPLSHTPDLPSIRKSSLYDLWTELGKDHANMKREIATARDTECGSCLNLAICHGGCPAEREARNLSYQDPQPLCLKETWKEAFRYIKVNPQIRKAVNNMVCMQNTQNAYQLPVCYRSSPLWWFPLTGQAKKQSEEKILSSLH